MGVTRIRWMTGWWYTADFTRERRGGGDSGDGGGGVGVGGGGGDGSGDGGGGEVVERRP
jgi:hypothetical protein